MSDSDKTASLLVSTTRSTRAATAGKQQVRKKAPARKAPAKRSAATRASDTGGYCSGRRVWPD